MIDKNSQDYADLKKAVALLEAPSVVAKIGTLVGPAIETALSSLPDVAQEKIKELVKIALDKAADAALWSLENKSESTASNFLHKSLAAAAGAAGGAFGFTALAVELPLTTTIILRSIADIARSEGFDLTDVDVKASCVEVFAFSGPSDGDDSTDAGYYATRAFLTETTAVLAKEMASIAASNAATQAGARAAKNITAGQAGGWIAKIIEAVAARFGVVVTEKVAAQIVPVVGALTGSIVNAVVIDFYQDVARGHFTILRLEDKYSYAEVEMIYKEIKDGLK